MKKSWLRKGIFSIGMIMCILGIMMFFTSMGGSESKDPVSATGVEKATADVVVQASGYTVEQENIKSRIEQENMPGSIKHLYIISAYSGQVIMYSTVDGKVTSSGKRLTPYSVSLDHGYSHTSIDGGFRVDFPGGAKVTTEVLQDDGTYGHSIPYLFWWDVRGTYHQHYVMGGQILHISDVPLPGVKSVILNFESAG